MSCDPDAGTGLNDLGSSGNVEDEPESAGNVPDEPALVEGRLSFRKRAGLVAGAWLSANVLAPGWLLDWRYFFTFPYGLLFPLRVFGIEYRLDETGSHIGWLVYGPLVAALLAIHRRRAFIMLYCVLCLLLLLNVAGCWTMVGAFLVSGGYSHQGN